MKGFKNRIFRVVIVFLFPFISVPLSPVLPVGAQMVFETGIGPDAFTGGSREKERKPDIHPFARALTLYFSSSTWEQVGISTASPARELTKFMYYGYYRQEMVQLILMSKESGKPFKEFARGRKKGKRFEELAEKADMDFSDIFERSIEIRKRIDEKILPEIPVSTVSLQADSTFQSLTGVETSTEAAGRIRLGAATDGPRSGWSIQVEVVMTPPELEKGLMYRKSLGPDEGMLFAYEDEKSRGFWMKNTWIGLDIVYIGRDKRIKRIFHNVPRSYPDTPDSKVARVMAEGMYVLEVAAGFAGEHDLQPGQMLDFKLE